MTKTLDLGCGINPKNPYNADDVYGVDIVDFGNPNIRIADLAIDKIPFKDNMFDYVSGFDVLEHIPRILYNGRKRTQPFIDLMSGVWRVLKPNGTALFYTPAYPHAEAFQDPQHVNIITERTISYFCDYYYDVTLQRGWSGLESGRLYGFIGQFQILRQTWSTDSKCHLIWELKAIK